jgi:hypothetical protein
MTLDLTNKEIYIYLVLESYLVTKRGGIVCVGGESGERVVMKFFSRKKVPATAHAQREYSLLSHDGAKKENAR